MNTIEIINDLLKEKGISASKMMKDLGFSSGLFSQWKKGLQNPSRKKLEMIAQYFNVSVDYLLGTPQIIQVYDENDNYDEIETCQHPTKQIELARLLMRMVNTGYKMIVSTHSCTMAAAINNLITLSAKGNKEELAVKLGYEKEDLINPTNIHAYQFIVSDGRTKVEELPNHFSIGVGFDFTLFNKANEKIYEDAVSLAEEY